MLIPRSHREHITLAQRQREYRRQSYSYWRDLPLAFVLIIVAAFAFAGIAAAFGHGVVVERKAGR